MEYDEVLEHVGPYGRHQMLAWFLVTVLSNWPFAWQTFSMNFLGYEPEHRCRIPFGDFNDTSVGDAGNYSFSSIGKCSLFANDTAGNNYTTGCEYGWWYSHNPVTNSIVTQWDLVCDKNFLAETAQAIFSFGILLGDLLFGFLADRYGRRKIFFGTLAGTAVVGSVAMFSPNVYIFLVFRFFLGTLTVGFWLTGYLLILEIFPPKQRTYFGILAAFGWNSGALTMALFGYLIRDWKTLQLVISLPALAGVLVWWFVPESVRWLLARGRQGEAQQLVYNMVKFNNKKLPEDFQLCVPISKKDRSAGDDSNNEEKTYTTLDLFRTPKIRLRIICCTILWIVNTLVYYGISFSAPSINGDFYLNFFLLMVIEVPAVMLALLLAWRIGRRMPLIVSGMLAGIACIVTPFIPTDTG
ncbi:solute carrier family 22 member 3-like [Lingula anatina]|uniref:Solute carrier family 22 member 3-like n=1 Tax=Lingula anatina TaxID=7574 RepID=A0A1S3HZL9_LINAN|nr:solute carrier family 22 member 3-like [Lingula anatina]|eukprot:XP_013390539.1 solute carrier family 22 member 3-like [Lingula anatina]